MKHEASSFTTIYTQWLESFRALLPGASQLSQPAESILRESLSEAQQEWEDEGGCVTPEKAPAPATAPKIPF